MGVLLHGRFDTERQRRGGTRQLESTRLTGGWHLVLSSGKHSRARAELQFLDKSGGNDPIHLQYESPVDLARFFREADSLSREKPIHVVHAHDLYSAATALLGRKTYAYRVIADYSPAVKPLPAENGTHSESGLASIGFRAMEILEEWVVQNADHVIVTTRSGARYLRQRYSLEPRRLSVVPNCIDAPDFRHDAAAGKMIRSELGLAYRLIATHVEDFHEPQDIYSLVSVFLNLYQRMPAAHLLSLSSDPHHAQEYLALHLPEGSFTVLNPSPERLPAYLSASDLGFVLPPPSTNSSASSPVLFAQFLNCGVPVIISSGVGDFSNLVRHKMLGEVLRDLMISEKLIQAVVHSRDEFTERCIQEGRSLTWQHLQAMARNVF